MSDEEEKFVTVTVYLLCGETLLSKNPRILADAKKALAAALRNVPLHGSDAGCFGILEARGLLHDPNALE